MLRRNSFALLAVTTLLLCLTLPALAQVTFQDFSDVSNLDLNPAAAQATNGAEQQVLRLTPDSPNFRHRSGSAFVLQRQSLGDGFTTVFRFQITHNPENGAGPADGLAFVIQNSEAGSNAIGGSGG